MGFPFAAQAAFIAKAQLLEDADRGGVVGIDVSRDAPCAELFEGVLNAVHSAAPQAAIAFNEGPETTADAVARWVERQA